MTLYGYMEKLVNMFDDGLSAIAITGIGYCVGKNFDSELAPDEMKAACLKMKKMLQ